MNVSRDAGILSHGIRIKSGLGALNVFESGLAQIITQLA